jgi:hypothetical protein
MEATNSDLQQRLMKVEMNNADWKQQLEETEMKLQTTMEAVLGVSDPVHYQYLYVGLILSLGLCCDQQNPQSSIARCCTKQTSQDL